MRRTYRVGSGQRRTSMVIWARLMVGILRGRCCRVLIQAWAASLCGAACLNLSVVWNMIIRRRILVSLMIIRLAWIGWRHAWHNFGHIDGSEEMRNCLIHQVEFLAVHTHRRAQVGDCPRLWQQHHVDRPLWWLAVLTHLHKWLHMLALEMRRQLR